MHSHHDAVSLKPVRRNEKELREEESSLFLPKEKRKSFSQRVPAYFLETFERSSHQNILVFRAGGLPTLFSL